MPKRTEEPGNAKATTDIHHRPKESCSAPSGCDANGRTPVLRLMYGMSRTCWHDVAPQAIPYWDTALLAGGVINVSAYSTVTLLARFRG